MEKISGKTVKQMLYEQKGDYESQICHSLALHVGVLLSKLHSGNVIHGDLTTSNVMLKESDVSKPVLLDLGLSYQSNFAEDKAVDLYVLERAFLSTHPNSKKLFYSILAAYKTHNTEESSKVISRLEEVRKRGRKKLLFG